MAFEKVTWPLSPLDLDSCAFPMNCKRVAVQPGWIFPPQKEVLSHREEPKGKNMIVFYVTLLFT